jgi:hypothetical protein
MCAPRLHRLDQLQPGQAGAQSLGNRFSLALGHESGASVRFARTEHEGLSVFPSGNPSVRLLVGASHCRTADRVTALSGCRTIKALSCCDPYYADPEFRGLLRDGAKGIAFAGADAAHA